MDAQDEVGAGPIDRNATSFGFMGHDWEFATHTRTNVGVEFYNLTNANAVLTYNQAFIPNGA